MPKIKVDIHPDNFLPVYHHTIGSTFDIELLFGSRDSGKSRHIAQIFVTLAMAMPRLRCVLIRKVFNTIKESQWQMIKEVAEEWKVDHLFKFNKSPLEILCISGASFICRGLDDPKKLKSVTNPTHAWVEEADGTEENDWTLITTSLRSNEYNTQIWVSFNPDVPGIYTDFWLYKKFFAAHPDELSFSMITKEELILDDGTVEIVPLRVRATHSTWLDNPYCKPSRKAYYLGLKRTSEYDHRVYCLGLWGTRKVGDEFFKRFQANIHVKRVEYNPRLPVYASIDNNVFPYCALTFWQICKIDDIYYCRQIGENPARPPENSAYGLAKNIIAMLRRLNYRVTGQFVGICGDRSTKNLNTIDVKKRSFFQIVNEQVKRGGFRVEDKFLSFAPSPSAIADFINAIFNDDVPNIQIEIDDRCGESIKDYGITKADKDGNILKIRKADYEGGPAYEHNGHLTDTAKDFIVQAMFPEFERFCNRHQELEAGGLSVVNRTSSLTP